MLVSNSIDQASTLRRLTQQRRIKSVVCLADDKASDEDCLSAKIYESARLLGKGALIISDHPNDQEFSQQSGLPILTAQVFAKGIDVRNFDDQLELLIFHTSQPIKQHMVKISKMFSEVILEITDKPGELEQRYASIKMISQLSAVVKFCAVLRGQHDTRQSRRCFERLRKVCHKYLGKELALLEYSTNQYQNSHYLKLEEHPAMVSYIENIVPEYSLVSYNQFTPPEPMSLAL